MVECNSIGAHDIYLNLNDQQQFRLLKTGRGITKWGNAIIKWGRWFITKRSKSYKVGQVLQGGVIITKYGGKIVSISY